MNEHMRIVEINGIKLEIDTRLAKKIEEYRVGDNVKVLVKVYSSYKACAGVIVGFDEFPSLPTITICYIIGDYTPEIKFAYINSESKDIEICPLGDVEKILDFDRASELLNKEIFRLEKEIYELKAKKKFFTEKYNTHFELKNFD
jgi:ribosomal protein L19